MSTTTDAPPGLGRRLLWFAGLYVAGIAVTGGVAFALKLVLTP